MSSDPITDRHRRHPAATLDSLPPGRYLAVEDGDEYLVVALDKPVVRVGRSIAADVRLDDASVSRRHALLITEQDGIHLVDDRSLNGLEVNGERVPRAILSNGDVIAVGRVRLRFVDV